VNTKYLILGTIIVAAGVAFTVLRPEPVPEAERTAATVGTAMVAITMPDISGNAALGRTIFENTCAACHGAQGVGNVEAGPPLIHKIYEPSHHGDESFQRAVANGVRAHHWRFGDMPAVDGFTRGDVAMVIAYIREIQRANGIE
jgi:mono/diheme cytochrome c family protein